MGRVPFAWLFFVPFPFFPHLDLVVEIRDGQSRNHKKNKYKATNQGRDETDSPGCCLSCLYEKMTQPRLARRVHLPGRSSRGKKVS